MNISIYCRLALIICSVMFAGCQKAINLSGDAKQLEKTFALTDSSPRVEGDSYKTADVPVLAKTLAVALRSNDLDTAASALHSLNLRSTGLSFDQYNAIRNAFGDVSAELTKRAAKGDDKAKNLLNRMSP
jgi:hypothetical protein